MGRYKKIDDEIFLGLYETLVKAYRDKHYIESAIIGFQLVEVFLRLVIYLYAIKNASPKDIIERLEDEQRFFKLVIFLGLVKPDNELCHRLFKFNEKRNKIVHQLYYVESLTTSEITLKDFCKESMALIESFKKLVFEIE